MSKSKKTVKVLVPRSENTRAQRMYLITAGLMIWAGTIRMALIIQQIVLRHTLDPIAAALEIIIYICFVTGVYAILKVKPPLHHLIPIGAAINFIPSYFAGSYGYLSGLGSALLLYIAIRFPIHFEWEKKVLDNF